MAHFPGTTPKAVVPVNAYQEDMGGMAAVDNNDHFAHEPDNDPDADYATAEEFDAYSDPDSIRDIFREEFQRFYVPKSAEKTKTKVKMRRMDIFELQTGVVISTVPVIFYGIHFWATAAGVWANLTITDKTVAEHDSTKALAAFAFTSGNAVGARWDMPVGVQLDALSIGHVSSSVSAPQGIFTIIYEIVG